MRNVLLRSRCKAIGAAAQIFHPRSDSLTEQRSHIQVYGPGMDRRKRVAGGRRRPRRSARKLSRLVSNPGVAALIGALIGSLLTGGTAVWVGHTQQVAEDRRQEAQIAEEDHDELATLRLAAYRELLATGEDYKLQAMGRAMLCKPGTDEPLREGGECVPELRGRYQDSRGDFQRAVNEVYRVGSEHGRSAANIIIGALPNAVYSHFETSEGMPDLEKFDKGYNAVLDVMYCETRPDVPSSCPPERG